MPQFLTETGYKLPQFLTGTINDSIQSSTVSHWNDKGQATKYHKMLEALTIRILLKCSSGTFEICCSNENQSALRGKRIAEPLSCVWSALLLLNGSPKPDRKSRNRRRLVIKDMTEVGTAVNAWRQDGGVILRRRQNRWLTDNAWLTGRDPSPDMNQKTRRRSLILQLFSLPIVS